MKITNLNPTVKFVSANVSSPVDGEKTDKEPASVSSTQQKDKIIAYASAAAAITALVIGGIYVAKRIKLNSLKKQVSTNISQPEKPAIKPEILEKPVERKVDNPVTTLPEKTVPSISKPINKSKDKNLLKKPFELPEQFRDFSKLEGERKKNVVTQYENGKIRRQFLGRNRKNVIFYSEFDDNGQRVQDVEFRINGTVKAIRKYKNGKFSEISYYSKDGITPVKTFTDEDAALNFSLNFR